MQCIILICMFLGGLSLQKGRPQAAGDFVSALFCMEEVRGRQGGRLPLCTFVIVDFLCEEREDVVSMDGYRARRSLAGL